MTDAKKSAAKEPVKQENGKAHIEGFAVNGPVQSIVTIESIETQLQAASKANDWAKVSELAIQRKRLLDEQVAQAKLERELKARALESEVHAVIEKAIKPLVDSKKLDVCDGIWFSYDFGAEPKDAIKVRLTKVATKPVGSSGGKGKLKKQE